MIGVTGMKDVMRQRNDMITQCLVGSDLDRNPNWVQAVAVGGKGFLMDTKQRLGQAGRYRHIKGSAKKLFFERYGW